jgi:WD40 repeat protein
MCIAFNGDSTQVGVSYRGFPLSVWEVNEARCIGRCRRAKEPRSGLSRPSTSWFAVDRFTWNPVSGHIIGIYKDGCIFKWHPVTNETQEVQSSADEVAASPDGKLFVTSDSNGTIRVWNFAYFSIIYQLSSADLVTGLTFSPDCRRFYDLRGSCVNAWESNSLIRFSEAEESFSDTGSEHQASTSVSQASEACLVQYEAVTALAIPQSTSLYCVGNEEGVLNLFDAATEESIELTRFLNFLSVSLLAWSQDATHIAAADLGGDIVVKRLVSPVNGSLKTGFEAKSITSPKFDLEGRGIHQLLFSYDLRSLLVICEDQGKVWAVDEGKMRASATLTNGTSRKWLNHPTQKHLFLGFGAGDVKVFQWHDFAEQTCFYFQGGRSRLNSQTTFDDQDIQDDKVTDLIKLSLGEDDAWIHSSSYGCMPHSIQSITPWWLLFRTFIRIFTLSTSSK